MKKALFLSASLLLVSAAAFAQGYVPRVHGNILADDKGRLYIKDSSRRYYLQDPKPTYTLAQLKGNPKGDTKGIAFYFGDNNFKGLLYYGLIPYGDSKHPQPVYFKEAAPITNGSAFVNIADKLKGKYDMVGWEKSGAGTIGYRVLNEKGEILYDGIVGFTGKGPFKVAPTIIEGPFVNLLTHNGVTISFETNEAVKATLSVGGKVFTDSKATHHHEVEIKGLQPDSTYSYIVSTGTHQQTYSFTTAPKPGSRQFFTFSYASDSRNGNGGGERNVYGANYYIMKKMMALNNHKGIAFAQFSGDLIDGYLADKGEINLQYANWKRAIEPFAHYFPVYISMGNHEALSAYFTEEGGKTLEVDKFPYATESAEAVFADNFVNPKNGPASEDGASYDPDPKAQDFPSYNENVFYYTYDNVGVVVLNSNYWYAPNTDFVNVSGGNIHGYIMDKQLEWLDSTIKLLEEDKNIDHVFLTLHTPMFPNGGHVKDDMWYSGNNQFRPYVRGQALDKGIIQRRDQLLHIIVNKSTKVAAVLTGDEHNYCTTEIGPNTPIYPEDWTMPRQQLTRTIMQINNGAAGAPYYAQEQTPWTKFTDGFTTQNAVVYFHVEGKSIEVEVVNPDTLEEIESFILRKP